MTTSQTEKTYLTVEYEENEKAKAAGCRFDPEARAWYILPGARKYNSVVRRWGRAYMYVPYHMRAEAKSAGFQWDRGEGDVVRAEQTREGLRGLGTPRGCRAS